ncbi:MAG: GAF domain-containing protein [Anaerolineales bacterium]
MNLPRFIQPVSTSPARQEGLSIWRERILSMVFVFASIGGTVVYVLNMLLLIRQGEWILITTFTLAYLWLLGIALVPRLPFNFRAGNLLAILYLLGVLASLRGMLAGDGRTWLGGFAVLTALLFGLRAGSLAAAGSTATLLVIGLLFKAEIIPMSVVDETIRPDNFAIWVNTSAAFLVINIIVVTALALLITNLGENLGRMSALSKDLESRGMRLQRQTQLLEKRSRHLEASAQISQAVSSILEPDPLIRQVVGLIREQFDLYYVGLFQVDGTGEWAVLQAGTGKAGRAMLARKHRLKVGEGMIGWSVANAQARVALEAGEDAVRLATPELPETRSEAAIPLHSRGQVLGALTVQDTQPGIFDEATIVVLQTMADQVAVAIDNARLFAASQEALKSTRRAYGELSREAWQELIRGRPELSYRSDPQGVAAVEGVWHPEMEQAWQEGKTIQTNGDAGEKRSLAVPIKVRGSVIGVVDMYKPGEAGGWTPEEISTLENLTNQLGIVLDGARLYEETQQQAEQEHIIGEIAARMRETLNVESVLQTAVRAIGDALDTARIEIQMSSGERK